MSRREQGCFVGREAAPPADVLKQSIGGAMSHRKQGIVHWQQPHPECTRAMFHKFSYLFSNRRIQAGMKVQIKASSKTPNSMVRLRLRLKAAQAKTIQNIMLAEAMA